MKVKAKRLRDRHELTEAIANVELSIAAQRSRLISGETDEQIGDVPGAIKQAADDLLRLARELEAIWRSG